MKYKVVGADPSLSNWGICRATLDINTLEIQVTGFDLIETTSENAKQTRKNSDDIRRAQELTKGLQEATPGAVVAFCEVPVGSQSARAMASYGISIGVLGGCTVPLIEVTAFEVKLAGTGLKNATKQEMISAAVAKHPEAPWIRKSGKLLAKNEHLADALFAIYAGIHTPQFATVLHMLRATNQKVAA